MKGQELFLIGDGQVYPSGGEAGNTSYLIVTNGTANGAGSPWCIIGMSMLERYSVYFELSGVVGPGKVSFAQSESTFGTYNTNWAL